MKNIILISVDCLRVDHAGYVKNAKLKPPTMMKLASEGYAYENCIVQAPFTTASHATMLTGLYPFEHGIRHLWGERLSKDTKMIQHDMKERRYFTAGLVSCFHMSHIGLNYGFDIFEYHPDVFDDEYGRQDYRTAEDLTDRAIDILEDHDRTFLFLHYFDAHVHTDFQYEQMYKDEIMIIDKQIERLVDFCGDDTLFVITGDHGKKWSGEHNFPCLNPRYSKRDPLVCDYTDKGEGGHGAELYDEILRVPLIVWNGRDKSGSVYEDQMEMANLREIIGYECWLYPAIVDRNNGYAYIETFSPDMLFDEGISQIGLRTPEHKLICYQYFQSTYVVEDKQRHFIPGELYDLKNDPKETINLVVSKPRTTERLFTKLIGIVERFPIYLQTQDFQSTDGRVKERLRGMGYL